MSVFMNGKKASRLFIGGKDINKAYYNGKLIFQKDNWIPSFGNLIWQTTQGVKTVTPITEVSDFELLCSQNEVSGSSTNEINFSFGPVLQGNIIGWEFNPDPKVSFVSTSIPSNFLRALPSLNCDIIIPKWVQTIGNNFISGGQGDTWGIRMSFNGNVTIGPNVKSIGSGFLFQLPSFNKEINTNKVTTIGDGFLSNCGSFNKNVYLPNVITIGNSFLGNDGAFNKPVNFEKLQSIGTGALSGCSSLNGLVSFGEDVEDITIGSDFMIGTTQYSQGFILKPNMNIQGRILCGIRYDITNNLYCECNPNNIALADDRNPGYFGGSFANQGVPEESNAGGFRCYGTYVAEMMAKFPNFESASSSGFYRNLSIPE